MLSQKLIDNTIAIWAASSPLGASDVFRYVAVPIISALEVLALYSNYGSPFLNTAGQLDNPLCDALRANISPLQTV